MDGKFLGRFFCLHLIGILHATTDHGELVPEEGRLVFLLPNGIRIVSFLPFLKIHDQLQTNGISKRFEAQKRDWTQIVDFLT